MLLISLGAAFAIVIAVLLITYEWKDRQSIKLIKELKTSIQTRDAYIASLLKQIDILNQLRDLQKNHNKK